MVRHRHTICPVCSKKIHKNSLHRHLTNVHHHSEELHQQVTEERIRAARCHNVVCPICAETLFTHELLAKHCEEKHSEDGADGRPQDYTVFEKLFIDEDEFQQWLAEECQKRCTSFSVRSAMRRKSGLKQRMGCNRAGKYVRKSTTRIRGSRKEQLHCPSFLNADIRNDGTVFVKGCFGHAGHSLNPELLRLSSGEREILYQLLEENTIDNVFQWLRIEFGNTESKLAYLTKTDLLYYAKKLSPRADEQNASDLTPLPLPTEEDISYDTVIEESEEFVLPEPRESELYEQEYGGEEIFYVNEEQELVSEQPRKEHRLRLLNSIISRCATVRMNAEALAAQDDEEAMEILETIDEYMRCAATAAPSSTSFEVEPETTNDGGRAHPMKRKELKESRWKLVPGEHQNGEASAHCEDEEEVSNQGSMSVCCVRRTKNPDS